MSQETKRVLILGSRNYGNRRILFELKKLKMKAQIVEPKHFVLAISNTNGNDKIYYKGKRIFKNSIDFVISRIGTDFKTGLKVLEHLQNNLKIACTASATGLEMASDKFLCSQILSQAEVKTPKSVHFKDTNEYGLLKKLVGGYPFVVKLNRGSQGAGVFLINDDLAGSTALSTISKISMVCLQQYIESAIKDAKKCDIRMFVVAGKVIASMKRFSIKSDFRSNYSISKEAINHKPTERQIELALKAAKSLDNMNICGVDIVTSIETGEDYVIECNGNPGTGIAKITGINIFEKIAEMAQNWSNDKSGELCYNPGSSNPINLEAKRKYSTPEEKYHNDEIFEFDDNDPGANENEVAPNYETEQEFNSKIFDNSVSWMTNVLDNDVLQNFDNSVNLSHLQHQRQQVIQELHQIITEKKY